MFFCGWLNLDMRQEGKCFQTTLCECVNDKSMKLGLNLFLSINVEFELVHLDREWSRGDILYSSLII